jgi:hypothetical protein
VLCETSQSLWIAFCCFDGAFEWTHPNSSEAKALHRDLSPTLRTWWINSIVTVRSGNSLRGRKAPVLTFSTTKSKQGKERLMCRTVKQGVKKDQTIENLGQFGKTNRLDDLWSHRALKRSTTRQCVGMTISTVLH